MIKKIGYKKRDVFRMLILNGNFKEAYFEHAINMQYKELSNEVIGLGFDVQNIMVYAFACYLITQNDCIDYHYLAFEIMCHPLCFIDGAYSVALYHNKRVLEIEPDNIGAMEMMLFFNGLNRPDRCVSDDEAKQWIEKILKKDPQNEIALNHLAELNI